LVTAQLLFLEAEDPERDIQLYINSPGGSITAGNLRHDAVREARRGDDLCWRGGFDGRFAADRGCSHEALLAAQLAYPHVLCQELIETERPPNSFRGGKATHLPIATAHKVVSAATCRF
jgi:hypothetical protein